MDNLKLHHIGVATKNIEKEFEVFKKLGYKQSSEVFIDEIQGIRGMFIEARGQPCLELLENLSSDGPLTSFLQKEQNFIILRMKLLILNEVFLCYWWRGG